MQDIFLPGIYLQAFFLSKSVCRTFFLKLPITPSKVKWSTPKIHQTFNQLTDSDLSIISKGFWNNRGQNSVGERGGIRIYLPLPGKSVRTYGDVIAKFSRMDSSISFLHAQSVDLARAKSKAPINKFIIKSNKKLVIHKSVNLYIDFFISWKHFYH